MRVFISWSGERSKGLAQAFREWLPMVLHYVDPFMSDADIDAGDRWNQVLAKELEACSYGIVCVTSENVNEPWVLFEAGALAKSLDTSKVIPVLLDLEFSDLTGPLSHFHATKLDVGGVGDVIHSLQASADSPLPEERANKQFEALWPGFKEKIEEIPDQPPTERHVRPQHEVLEDLVAGVRNLDARMRDSEETMSDLPPSRRRRSRVHPMMFRELQHMMMEGPDDPVGLLILASLIRDDAPWLYELTVDAYRSTTERVRSSNKRAAFRRLERAVEMTMHGPMIEEWGGDPRAMDMFMHEIMRYTQRYSEPDSSSSPAETDG